MSTANNSGGSPVNTITSWSGNDPTIPSLTKFAKGDTFSTHPGGLTYKIIIKELSQKTLSQNTFTGVMNDE